MICNLGDLMSLRHPVHTYVCIHTKKPRERQSKNKGIFQKCMDTKDRSDDALVYDALHTHTPKLQVIFRKRATNYRALLRKMTYTNKAFYVSTPPCTMRHMHTHVHTYVYIYTQKNQGRNRGEKKCTLKECMYSRHSGGTPLSGVHTFFQGAFFFPFVSPLTKVPNAIWGGYDW